MRLATHLNIGTIALAAALPVAVAIAAPVAVEIIQKGRAFSAAAIDVARGTAVRFLNQDEFIHHIFVDAPSFKFDSGEQPPGEPVTVTFGTSGTFEVRCAIHPKMRLGVTVN